MKTEVLFEAFADINERYVEEAREASRPSKKRKLWVLAACLALVLIAAPLVHRGITQAREDIIVVNESGFDYLYVSFSGEFIHEEVEAVFESEFGIPYDKFAGRMPEGYSLSCVVASMISDDDNASVDAKLNYCLLIAGMPNGKCARVYLSHGYHKRTSPMIMIKDGECEASRIDGVEVTICRYDSVFNNAIADEYFAFFEQDGIYYDVRMHADSVDELTELLSALID